eukprot:620920-Karenia_brevis.AAC.1
MVRISSQLETQLIPLDRKLLAVVDRCDEEYEQHMKEEQERREREGSEEKEQSAVAEAHVAARGKGQRQKEGRSKNL